MMIAIGGWVQDLGEDWVGIGDFNETIFDSEASRRGLGPFRRFLADFVDLVGCVDLGFKGKTLHLDKWQRGLCKCSKKTGSSNLFDFVVRNSLGQGLSTSDRQFR